MTRTAALLARSEWAWGRAPLRIETGLVEAPQVRQVQAVDRLPDGRAGGLGDDGRLLAFGAEEQAAAAVDPAAGDIEAEKSVQVDGCTLRSGQRGLDAAPDLLEHRSAILSEAAAMAPPAPRTIESGVPWRKKHSRIGSWLSAVWPYALLVAVGLFILLPKLGD